MSKTPSLWKTFLIFLAPLMLSNALQSLFGTVSNALLGQMIGVDALAAVSVFFPVMFFLFAFVMGLSTGATVLIGQAWGAGERDKVKAVAGATLAVGLLLAMSVALFGGLFSRQLMIALATPPDILDQASAYARVMLLTMPLGFVFLLMTAMLRGVGDTLTPLMALAVVDRDRPDPDAPPHPRLVRTSRHGVTAPAWASAIANALTLFALGLYLRHKKSPLAPDAEFLRRLRLDGALLGKILGIGIPSAVGMVVMAIAELVLLGLVNGFGSDATAAYGAVNQIMGYAQFTAISISISVSILGAQAIGGGHADRLDAIVRTGLLLNLVLTGGLVALIYLFPRAVLGIFITDAAVLELAKGLLIIALWSSVPFGMATVFSGAMRAGGVALAPMLLSIFAIVADRDTRCRDPEPDHRTGRGLGRLSDRVQRHVHPATRLLHAGLASPPASADGVTRAGRAFPRYYDRHNTVDALPALRHNAPKHRETAVSSNPQFLFDFGSPNAFLSHEAIPAIEKRANVKFEYVPILLGGIFKSTNNKSPAETLAGIKNKREFHALETERFLKRFGVKPYVWNPFFPVNTLNLMRAAVAAQFEGVFEKYVEAAFHHMWVEPKKMDDPEVAAKALASSGLDAATAGALAGR